MIKTWWNSDDLLLKYSTEIFWKFYKIEAIINSVILTQTVFKLSRHQNDGGDGIPQTTNQSNDLEMFTK